MTASTDDVVIRAQELHKTYGEGGSAVHALAGVDVVVRRGESAAVMGPSGSGKSTLLHILACLHKPSGGQYELGGRDIESLSNSQLSRVRNEQVGIVFQMFNLLPQETIVRNVALPLVYSGVPKKEREARARKVLTALGLGHRLTHLPTQLSGGEDQRVAIARALVTDPSVILADEPTGNLDSRTGEEIMAIFGKLNAMGKTLVMITHDPRIAEHAHRIVRIKDGEIESREEVESPRRSEAADIDCSFLEDESPRRAAFRGWLSPSAWLETLRVALMGLGVHKVRAFLSMLGIIFGVSSVMAVLSVVAGARGEVMKQLKALGANNVIVTARTLSKDRLKKVKLRSRGLSVEDGQQIAAQCGLIEAWAPLKKTNPKVTVGDKAVMNCEVVGTTPDFLRVTDFELAEGRFIQPQARPSA